MAVCNGCSSFRAGLGAGLISGAVLGLVVGPAFGLGVGLILGLIVGLLGGLSYGGDVALSYLALRLVLWRAQLMPWNIAAFLDFACHLLIMRRAGGGYQFLHRTLRDYLADQYEARAA